MMKNPIRLGVLGLGRAFTLMLPTFQMDARVRLVAACDPRTAARDAFAKTFASPAYEAAQEVCANPDVEWVYIATPHQMHAEHVRLAARNGKHVLVEKPMALTLADCDAMIEVCEQAGVHLLVGHSHSYDAPVRLAHQLIHAGRIGGVCMVHAMQYTDFLYRPRRPEELDTARGGGVVHSQAAHQMDIVRLLAGSMARSLRAATGRWDPARPTEGAYTALITFADGAFASATYNGYGFYDTDSLMEGIGELGQPKPADAHSRTRMRLKTTTDEAAEAALKAERNFGGSQYVEASLAPPAAWQHFGPVIVSGTRGDLRLTPHGVQIHDEHGQQFVQAPPPAVPRSEVIDELWAVGRAGCMALHDGRWSRATVELCLAILKSQESDGEIVLKHQVPVPPPPVFQ
jgi:phthalate 4,5-cis-dihydrodiol dehydrogenase